MSPFWNQKKVLKIMNIALLKDQEIISSLLNLLVKPFLVLALCKHNLRTVQECLCGIFPRRNILLCLWALIGYC